MGSSSPHLLIVVGSQRSGTTMLMETLERSDDIEVHHETSEAIMRNYRLISVDAVKQTLAQSTCGTVAIKPLCDSQWVDRILAQFDGSRAIWMFRNWWDVTNSRTRKWPGRALEVASAFARGDTGWLGWRQERIDPATQAEFDAMLAEATTDEAAGAAFWWLRNRHFFDHGLSEQPEFIRPMRYEQLVEQPSDWIRKAAEFAQFHFDSAMVDDVHTLSIGRASRPEVPARIHDACDQTLEQLIACSEACW